MRAGLSTILQTLTPEAASVLNHSIAEATRRNHGQTTPLHVAATLLSSPTGYLRQACIKSHPNSSHPLQCRALELCFSVALERLPTTQNMSPGMEPPISNALMAALKRAQAHQRRGCPEQQQQPLLAVKVELEQLIISILDDPSVSRVMREASFSSPAVKATIEQSLNSAASASKPSPIGLGFRPTALSSLSQSPTRNLYLNPRLQQGGTAQSGQQRGEELRRVIDILLRTKKRNPVLVGESEPEAVTKELLRKIENKEMDEGPLKNTQVIHFEKELFLDRAQMPTKIKELVELVETRMRNLDGGGGIILSLGDLKWLVEQPVGIGVSGSGTVQQQQVVSEGGRAVVAEMGKLLETFGETNPCRLWLIATATCETYLRCQVYHPSMENDWDLQALPVAARPLPGMFPRLGSTGILSKSVESISSMKGLATATTIAPPPTHVSENTDSAPRISCCPQCTQNYEQELAEHSANEFDKSSSEVKEATRPQLPQWLQNAKSHEDKIPSMDQELQKKWNEKCLKLHPKFHHMHNNSSERTVPMSPLSMTSLYNPNLLGRQPFQPKFQLNKSLGESLQLKIHPLPSQPSRRLLSQPASPVRTELVLGQTRDEIVKDFFGRKSAEPDHKPLSTLDVDSFKKLLKGLTEKVWWQREAASAVASTVTRCKSGNGKRRSAGSKGDMWLLFMGPDRVGKKKMTSALAELVSGSNPVIICLGSHQNDGESNLNIRGKTSLDRISEAVRRNPLSVIMLEDIDEADMLVRGSIKRAMERGRLTDSHGREISLGNVIFVLTSNQVPDHLKHLSNGIISLDEEKLASLGRGGWQLRLSLCGRTVKRRISWVNANDDRSTKQRNETTTGSGLGFDLNETADDAEDDIADGSHNSSDLTIEHGLTDRQLKKTAFTSRELLDYVDDSVVFKPVDFSPIRQNITNSITKKVKAIVGDKIGIELEDEALDKILSGVWLGNTGVEEWTEKVFAPSFHHQLKTCLPSTPNAANDESTVLRLELDSESGSRCQGDWLPSCINVVIENRM